MGEVSRPHPEGHLGDGIAALTLAFQGQILTFQQFDRCWTVVFVANIAAAPVSLFVAGRGVVVVVNSDDVDVVTAVIVVDVDIFFEINVVVVVVYIRSFAVVVIVDYFVAVETVVVVVFEARA